MLSLTDKDFRTLTQFVHQKFGIDLSKKRILIEGRLSNALQERNITSFQEYMDILFADKSGAEVTLLLNKLTTNHTFFMRENEHFEFLANHVLPYFERVSSSHVLRIWSAGCSSGQEPYTMAMAIRDYFGPRKSMWDTVILASDISMKALEKAKLAIYTTEEIKDVPPAWKTKYFTDMHNGSFQVIEAIRKEVVFKTVNLMEPFPFKKPFDLIFCRNVMIYFDSPTKDKLIGKFYDHSAEGAFLFIGHSENINKEATKYRYIKPAIYQKGGR